MRLDPRSTSTVQMTTDEFGVIRERLDRSTEIGRVFAEAEAMSDPIVEPVKELREIDGFPDGVLVEVGEIVYEYAVTVPPADLGVAKAALEAEGFGDVAAALQATAS